MRKSAATIRQSKNALDTLRENARIKPADYLGVLPATDKLGRLEELIRAGEYVLAYTAVQLTDRALATNPYFYFDVHRFYTEWRVACKKFFAAHQPKYRDEFEVFDETDSVGPSVMMYAEPEQPNERGDKLLVDIRSEVRSKLSPLRAVRMKLRRGNTENTQGVRSVVVVETDVSREIKITVIINHRYAESVRMNYARVSSSIDGTPKLGAGALLYDLATNNNSRVPVWEYKESVLDSLHDKRCAIYTKLKDIKVTRIIAREKDYYVPADGVKITSITEDSYGRNKRRP